MLHRLRHVTRLLVAVLLVQVVLAPVHCLVMAAAPAGLETVLCSPDGARVVHLGPDGQDLPAHDADAGSCVVCMGFAKAVPAAPALAAMPAEQPVGLAWHAAGAEHLPPAARAPPYRPTGPPALS